MGAEGFASWAPTRQVSTGGETRPPFPRSLQPVQRRTTAYGRVVDDSGKVQPGHTSLLPGTGAIGVEHNEPLGSCGPGLGLGRVRLKTRTPPATASSTQSAKILPRGDMPVAA